MRATVVLASALALGAAWLRRRRERRDQHARVWAEATDPLDTTTKREAP